jgi:hypothetical protein
MRGRTEDRRLGIPFELARSGEGVSLRYEDQASGSGRRPSPETRSRSIEPDPGKWGRYKGRGVAKRGAALSRRPLAQDRESETPQAGEVTEVGVPGHQAYAVIHAALGDERVRQARPAAPCDELGAQASCPIPLRGLPPRSLLEIGRSYRSSRRFRGLKLLAYPRSSLEVDPDVTAWSRIDGVGTLGDFAKLQLAPNTDAMVQAYLKAAPGDTLNLSEQESAAFRKLGASGGDARTRVELRCWLRTAPPARPGIWRVCDAA